jgi:hypothetical protein
MSGDVFGNGLLYSDRVKLLAAFDHRHIFLDPDPDPVASHAERQRLFDLPRSSWADYDRKLISQGRGRLRARRQAHPALPEARAALGVDAEALSGQDLVKAILRAPSTCCGTVASAPTSRPAAERHGEVGDASNDGVRIDATELRARILGEGGNLGLTQLARIEFARGAAASTPTPSTTPAASTSPTTRSTSSWRCSRCWSPASSRPSSATGSCATSPTRSATWCCATTRARRSRWRSPSGAARPTSGCSTR